MTQTQMDIADTLDEMREGEGVEFQGGIYVERRENDVYVIGDERLCFIQAYDRVAASIR